MDRTCSHYDAGIAVQLPLPQGINEERIVSAISVHKDVEGVHPANIAKLCMQGRVPQFVPCTAKVATSVVLRNTYIFLHFAVDKCLYLMETFPHQGECENFLALIHS